jgi:peptidoglycan/LPS O-acetylase OafA/YrhL
MTKIYFPNLNGLRFIAASLVIIHHIEQMKHLKQMENYYTSIPFIGVIGKLGVVLFFVLSGFLITYLLLEEQKLNNAISVKKFYMRRVLRIWPLYFLIIILALLVMPNIELFTLKGFEKDDVYSYLYVKIALFVFFLPNLVSVVGNIPYASHTWSIGTEEQYYLIWPLLFKYIKLNKLVLLISIIIAYLLIGGFLNSQYSDFLPFKKIIRAFWNSFTISCMAIGGFFAVLLFNKSKLLVLLKNVYLFYFILIATMLFLAKGVCIPYFHNEFYAVLFGIIILNFASNEKIKINLENKYLIYLGNISYGLYMFHPIGIMIGIIIASTIQIGSNWVIYPLTFLITILLSMVSYKYFESYFLKFKKKFTIIRSGGDI